MNTLNIRIYTDIILPPDKAKDTEAKLIE